MAVLGSGTNVGPKESPESDPNPGQKHLDQLLKVMESYMNPANAGSLDLRSSIQTSRFIYKLTKAFVTRVHRERHAKKQVWTPNKYLYIQLGNPYSCLEANKSFRRKSFTSAYISDLLKKVLYET